MCSPKHRHIFSYSSWFQTFCTNLSSRDPNPKGCALGFFDGDSQGESTPPPEEASGIIHLSSDHSISFSAGNGNETNNLCELMALKLNLHLAH